LSQVCQQFNLTQREQEVLVHLLQGIRNKEIANRMNVSPNTVRAFLRLIMIKTGVSSRSAIVGKILTIQRRPELIAASPGPYLRAASVNSLV
jgi:DNA-binding CsgD family transcriptional regulator